MALTKHPTYPVVYVRKLARGKWEGYCACGWTSNQVATEREAVLAATDHHPAAPVSDAD